MKNGTRLAAVDIGSNSFRLEIGECCDGSIKRVEYHKEIVRQGKGLDAHHNLTLDALQRGWDCLGRFGAHLKNFEPTQLRAVATQTLREARNRDEFLTRGRELLGFPIEVIPGKEEARLIYLGVVHSLPPSNERRLVLDIGGRSTEIILGQALEPRITESYPVGSVAWSMRYFPDNKFTTGAFQMAEAAAKAALDTAAALYLPGSWDAAYGSSGTAGAAADALGAAGWPQDEINRSGLDWLLEELLKAGSADKLHLDGVQDNRKAVIGGGLAILRACFDLLGIHTMAAAEGALRQGVLYDLLDRSGSQIGTNGQPL